MADAALAFLTGAGVCLLTGASAIRYLARLQGSTPPRYEDCPPLLAYHEKKPRTPTMGGLFVLAAGVGAAAAWGGLRHVDGWLVLAAVVGLGSMGLLDDVLKFRRQNALGLRALPKLLVALAVGGAIGWAMGVKPVGDRALTLPWSAHGVDVGWGWVPLAMLVIAGGAHAVNLTDGMDGLAAGCVAIALVAVGCWAAGDTLHDRVVLSWCAALAGACVGFLWFNGFPASVYLGDVGSLGLGAGLAAVSMFSHTALWLVVIGGVFVVEAMSVMLQVASYKWRGKQRIFRVAPIHHHFHLSGVSEPKLIVRFWIVGVLLAAASLTARRWL